MHACQVSSVVSDSLRPYGLYPAGLLCPWDSPGENTRVGFRTLPQGNFLTEHMSPEAPALQAGSLPLSHQGSQAQFLAISLPALSTSSMWCHPSSSRLFSSWSQDISQEVQPQSPISSQPAEERPLGSLRSPSEGPIWSH